MARRNRRNIPTNGGTILIYKSDHTKGHLGDSWCHVCFAYLCLWSFHDLYGLYDIHWYTIYVIWCDLHRWISICLAIKSGAQIRISRKECLHLAIGIAFQSKYGWTKVDTERILKKNGKHQNIWKNQSQSHANTIYYQCQGNRKLNRTGSEVDVPNGFDRTHKKTRFNYSIYLL